MWDIYDINTNIVNKTQYGWGMEQDGGIIGNINILMFKESKYFNIITSNNQT